MWAYARDGAFVCRVRDSGRGLADPLAEYLVLDHIGSGDRGTWLAQRMCDIVEAATNDTGSRVCIRMML